MNRAAAGRDGGRGLSLRGNLESVFALPWLHSLSWFASASPAWPREFGDPLRPAPTFTKEAENLSAPEMKNWAFAVTGIKGPCGILEEEEPARAVTEQGLKNGPFTHKYQKAAGTKNDLFALN